MTKIDYLVGRIEIIGVKLTLLLMPESTKAYYMPKLVEVAKKYAVSEDYYESRLGFLLMKVVMEQVSRDLKSNL